ncbi:hypothetical protein C1646_717842, partial [Rhizophagus diaphanus]
MRHNKMLALLKGYPIPIFYSAPTNHCDPLENKFLIVCIVIVKIYFCRSTHTTLIIRTFFL